MDKKHDMDQMLVSNISWSAHITGDLQDKNAWDEILYMFSIKV